MKTLREVSLIANNKGMTPLMLAVEHGYFTIFRFLLELCFAYDQTVEAPKKLLPTIMSGRCDKKKETCLLKSVSTPGQLEITYSILHLITSGAVPYEVATAVDGVRSRNVLHWAVHNKQRDLIEVLVSKIDADKRELREAKDSKGKTPADIDNAGQFTELFNTVWDYAKEGNLKKLRQVIDSGRFGANDQTLWSKNTPLHIAVRNL